MRRESDTLRPGDRAPDFALQDPNGRVHTLKDLLSGAGTEAPTGEHGRAASDARGSSHGENVQRHENGVRAHHESTTDRDRTVPSRLLLVFDRGTW